MSQQQMRLFLQYLAENISVTAWKHALLTLQAVVPQKDKEALRTTLQHIPHRDIQTQGDVKAFLETLELTELQQQEQAMREQLDAEGVELEEGEILEEVPATQVVSLHRMEQLPPNNLPDRVQAMHVNGTPVAHTIPHSQRQKRALQRLAISVSRQKRGVL